MPMSELHNHDSAVEVAMAAGDPVFLAKEGYASMIMEQYESLTGNVEAVLDAADRQASSTTLRLSHNDVFEALRGELDRGEAI
jgi:hypothetical protein